MNNNKGFVGLSLILAIIAVLVVGGGAYYLGTKNTKYDMYQPLQKEENQPTNNNLNNEDSSIVKNDVVSQPAYLKSVYVKNGKNYIDVDYVQVFYGDESLKAQVEDGLCPNTKDCYAYPNGYKRNTNPLIRTFEVDLNALINVYGVFNQYFNNGNMDNEKSLISFTQLYNFFLKGKTKEHYIKIDVKNNIVVKIVEPYQE